MRSGGPKAIPAAGPPGPSAVTRASALQDVVDAVKAVLTASDLPSARAALGLGNVANTSDADKPISTATQAALASLASLVSANTASLSAILGGANASVDTFIEAYNRFLSDESAAAALTATVGALQTALTAETTRATAAEGSNATAISAEVTRAQAAEATNATAIGNEVTRATGVEATLAVKARQVATSGLATGGGDLSADRTITVPKASQADVAAGTDDAKALTAYAVSARFGLTAPLASPVFTGAPAAPTATGGTNTTQLATCAFVQAALGPYLTSVTAASTYATLASPTFTGTPSVPTAPAGTNTTQAASTAFVTAALSTVTGGMSNAVLYTAQSLTLAQQRQALTNAGASNSGVRQTVQSGPASAGAPSFLPSSTSGTLTLSMQGLTATPLVTSIAAGFDGGSSIDIVSVVGTNLSTTLAASSTLALYIDVGTGSTPSPSFGSTALFPIYQYGGTISTANGQYTFDIQAMQGWLGNGTTAAKCNRVFIGQAVTSATAVTSTIAYAYNGFYDSGWSANLPGAGSTIRSHNLGVQPMRRAVIIECTTADSGYAVGAQLSTESGLHSFTGSYGVPAAQDTTPLTHTLEMGGSGGFCVVRKSDYAFAGLTAANWKTKFVDWRGWPT